MWKRTVESESRSQLNNRGGDEMGGAEIAVFLRELWRSSHKLVCLKSVLKLWTVKIEPGLDLEFDGRTDAGL